MARYNTYVESVTAVASGNIFATVTAGSSIGFKLRRVTLGVRAGASVPTSQQLSVALTRMTTRGLSPASTTVGQKMDNNTASSGITGVDLGGFGTPPVLAATGSYEFSFNTQSGWDAPFELLEEFVSPTGTANGIGFTNVGNALPASHLYSLAVEWEE